MSSLLELLTGIFVLVVALKIVTTSFFVGSGTGPLTVAPFFFTVSIIFCADASTN